jgi:hypothetical protein
MSGQSDFFDAAGPTGELIPFPLAARIGRVRTLADELETLPPEKWQRRFNHRSRNIAAFMRDYFPNEEIDRQIEQFAEAVNQEMDRRAAKGITHG